MERLRQFHSSSPGQIGTGGGADEDSSETSGGDAEPEPTSSTEEDADGRIARLKREREFMRSRLYKSGFSDHIQVQGDQQAKVWLDA